MWQWTTLQYIILCLTSPSTSPSFFTFPVGKVLGRSDAQYCDVQGQQSGDVVKRGGKQASTDGRNSKQKGRSSAMTDNP
ncbi:hypothetical protein O3P69_017511 [Scylla paramamosain]|uniref:Secreted protein n=1 Tax=Scylla paramamosain TaxID=85552 RepID=A0AAW0TW41_SCYPA